MQSHGDAGIELGVGIDTLTFEVVKKYYKNYDSINVRMNKVSDVKKTRYWQSRTPNCRVGPNTPRRASMLALGTNYQAYSSV
jgi:hypothetical protein